MKNLFLTIALVFGLTIANAQVETHAACCNTNGKQILPTAGDCSLGFDATPVLNYFGNFFGNGENSVNMAYQSANTITGSYMKTDTKAYRVKVGIGYSNTSADSVKTNSTSVALGAGIQNFRGHGRLQGFYGAEAGVGFSNGKTAVNSIETETPNAFGVNVRGFLGAQYFVAPKVSLGAEYGWGLSYGKIDKTTSLNLGVDNLDGSIFLSLYF
jgi:hypothetical protein